MFDESAFLVSFNSDLFCSFDLISKIDSILIVD
jgi:hypothetical protein